MKKLIIILGLIFLTSSQAFAICDYSCMCPEKPYDVSSRAGQVTSSITGMTFLSERLADVIIKKELKKATKEKFKVEMKSYSANDLAHGRFKSLKISGKNLDIEGVHLSSFEAKTACNFNYVDLSKKSIRFKENMVMNFAMEISDSDLRETIQSSDYIKKLNSVNLSALGITFFKLTGADVKIKNDKLYFTIRVTSPLSATPVPVVIRADVKAEDGRIVLTKIDLVNLYTVIDLTKATSILNVLNPLTFSTEILNNKFSEITVQNIDIKGDRIFIKGDIFIPKNTQK